MYVSIFSRAYRHNTLLFVATFETSFLSLQAKFALEAQPRLLPLRAFAWDASDISRLFHGCQNGLGFCTVWNKEIAPKLSKTGTFEQLLATEQSPEAGISTPVNRKRCSASHTTPPPLMPATKVACTTATFSSCNSAAELDESCMDQKIQDHFVGRLHAIPNRLYYTSHYELYFTNRLLYVTL